MKSEMLRKKYRALLLLLCWLTAVVSQARTVRPVTLSADASYTDHVALATDATDKDLMVKFRFNELDNTFTVSIISFRTLFVFWDDTPYKGTIGCHRKIRYDRLPYVVTANPDDCFKLGKAYRQSLPRPLKKHVFKKWIEYDGLQPRRQELKMVNDYIEQTFDIQNRRNHVTVRLRDLMFLDINRRKGLATYYEVSYGKDLDLEYQVTIQRNPCFGLDEEMGTAQKSLAAVSKSYATLKKRYLKRVVSSAEALHAFQELQATLVAQFPHNNDKSPCPDIQELRRQYNIIADSLATMHVKQGMDETVVSGAFDAKDHAKNAKMILANARQIDRMVSQWISSSDDVERSDLVSQCRSIIQDTGIIIRSSGNPSAEERKAVNIFRQAEKYFNRTCR